MKIDVISALFGRPGGAENATRAMVDAMRRLGADAIVVGTRREARAYPYASVLRGTDWIPTPVILYGWNPLLDAYFEKRLLAHFLLRKPDVVMLEDHMLFLAATSAVREYNRRGGHARLVMSQIWDADTSFFVEFRGFPIGHWMHRHFQRLNAMSREMDLINAYVPFHKKQIELMYGVDPQRIVTVQTTIVERIDVNRQVPASRAVFIAPGRINPEKGSLFLLDAAEALSKSTRNFRLVYYGAGPFQRTLNEEIAKRALSDIVELRSPIPSAELRAEMAKSTALCLPIMYPPGITCVAIEALSAGVPVLAFRHGAIADVIADYENGILVEPRNVAQYAVAMKAFVDNPMLAAEMEEACRRTSESLNRAEDETKKLLDIFESRFGL